ncbi:MAG: hypothetical protein LBD04_08480 [Synergistaceae bacterium]|nr:hypothetical protein [Synergistaceae bacterium]
MAMRFVDIRKRVYTFPRMGEKTFFIAIPTTASMAFANALPLHEVVRFNTTEFPVKMGAFPQYDHPETQRRYARIAERLKFSGNTDEEKVQSLI